METVIGKKMKFRARDPLSALTHFIGFLAVIPPVICLLERSETTAQVISFAIFCFCYMVQAQFIIPCALLPKKLRF
mgnify:CR=1 FL=1